LELAVQLQNIFTKIVLSVRSEHKTASNVYHNRLVT